MKECYYLMWTGTYDLVDLDRNVRVYESLFAARHDAEVVAAQEGRSVTVWVVASPVCEVK
jgi:hypothetical protein